MKKSSYALSFLLFFITVAFLKAEFWNNYIDSYSVGKQPVAFIYDDKNQKINIFCAGYDANFNGTKDDEDESPSWWQASLLGQNDPDGKFIEEPYLVREFEFGSFQFPFRPGYEYPYIYYGSFNEIETYNIGNGEKISNNLPKISCVALTVHKDLLLISHRPSFTEPGFVYVFDLIKNQFIDTLKAGVNVQKAIFYQNNKIIVLNEGDFGAANSSVQIFKNIGEKYQLEKTILTGDVSNHITIVNDILIITNNNSHDLTLIDLNNNEIIKKIKLLTAGFSGPRESVYSTKLNQIITSTYNSVVYIHNFEGDLIESIETEANPEGLLLIESPVPLLFVANEFKKDTYEPNSSFQIFSHKTQSKVDFSNVNSEVSFNPSLNLIEIRNINFQNENLLVQIFNSLGELIHQEQHLNNNEFNIDLAKINPANGYYFLIIKNHYKSYSFPFVLAK